jgi:hypothetical protein
MPAEKNTDSTFSPKFLWRENIKLILFTSPSY